MTTKQPIENTQVKIPCANCFAVNLLEKMIDKRERPDLGLDLGIEHGLQCPDCGHWTHSYYMTAALEIRRQRLEVLHGLYNLSKTSGHWTTYETARASYQKEFDRVQAVIRRKVKV